MTDAHIEYSDSTQLIQDPVVSVVMATYRHELYLAEAIESVIGQKTTFPFELIIGEDSSTDGTRAVALDYQQRFPRMIRVITSARNVGMQANGRRMIASVRGKYIGFCEGDDFWHRPDKLQLQIDSFAADDSVVLVSAGMRTVAENGEVVNELEPRVSGSVAMEVGYEDVVLGQFFHPTCTVVARTSAVRRVLNEDSLCTDPALALGDLPMWLELSQLGRMIHLPEALASYRLSPNSATRRSDPLWGIRFDMSVCEVRYRALDKYPLPGDRERTTGAKLCFTRKLLAGAARVGDRSAAIGQWRRLRGLCTRRSLRDAAHVVIALLPLPRRSLIVRVRRILRYLERHGCW